MKMIKLVLIFMFYLFPLLVMAQVISIKPFDDGKELYFKAQDLFRNGKITEGSAVKDKAINKFKYAQKLVKEEKFKKEKLIIYIIGTVIGLVLTIGATFYLPDTFIGEEGLKQIINFLANFRNFNVV